MKPLTSKQWALLSFIQQFIATNGYPPTVREMRSDCRKSRATLNSNIQKLRRYGYLSQDYATARSTVPIVSRDSFGHRYIAAPIKGSFERLRPT